MDKAKDFIWAKGSAPLPMTGDGICTNPRIADRFTCPSCYKDLPSQVGTHVCQNCGAVVVTENVIPDYTDSVARHISVDDYPEFEGHIRSAGIEVEPFKETKE